jgi:hypothetical protein
MMAVGCGRKSKMAGSVVVGLSMKVFFFEKKKQKTFICFEPR